MKTSGASLNLTTAQSMAVRWFVFVAVAFLTGCAKVELHSNLDEQQANEMMSILLSEKIECEKTPGEEGT